MKKRLFPILMAILMVFAMMPMTAGTVFAIDIDTMPPEIDADSITLTLPEGKDAVTAGDKVKVSVGLTDNVGVKNANVIYQYKDSLSEIRTFGDFQYNAETEKWETELTITDNIRNGTWTIARISAADENASTDLWNSDVSTNTPNMSLSAYDFVVEGTDFDSEPPVIDADSITLTLPEGKDAVTAGDKVKVSVGLTDNIGVIYANIIFENKESHNREFRDLYYNAESGKWEAEFTIAENTYLGTWMIARISAADENTSTDLWNSEVPGVTPFTDLSAFDFTVVKCNRIAFDSRGGSEIAPQYVIPGAKATRPDDPTRDGGFFAGWYADEGLTQEFNFNTPITEDTTLYAKWYYSFSISNYDATNGNAESGGKYSVLRTGESDGEWMQGCMNMTLLEGDILTLKAKNDTGYKFIGWYKGVYTGDSSGQAAEPLDINDLDNLISAEATYEYTATGYQVICPVFEVCTDHQWDEGTVSKAATCREAGSMVYTCTVCGTERTEEIPVDADAHVWEQHIQKATPDAEGRTYQVCTVCGTEETVAPLLKVSNISLAGTSYTYTGKAITPKVTVANASETLSTDNYTVTYSGNTNAGTATAKVTLKGDYYEGSKSLTFKITAKKLTPTLTLSPASCVYNGKVRKPSVTVKDGTTALKKDTDYTVSYASGRKNAGSYKVSVTLKGNYSGSTSKTFKINQATNPLTIKAKTATVKYTAVKKKAQTLAVDKVITFTKKGQGKLSYAKVSGNKKITINKKTGKVTVKKGLKKGTYKVKVKVKAGGNTNYKASAVKTVTFTIKVK